MKATYKIIQDEISIKGINDPVSIWFFGDVHRDTRNCDVDRWKWFLKRAKESMNENTYFIGMGDYHDFASTREKAYLSRELHESTTNLLDLVAEEHNRDFAEEMSFARGRILGLIEGNHSWRFENGKDSTEDLAERLGTKDLGWLCHYSIIFKSSGSHTLRQAVHMILCHGKAGGKTLGITVNQVGDLKTIFPVADIYIEGHDHQRIAHPCTVLVPINGKNGYALKQKRQLLCRSGSFMKAYEDGSNSYQVFKLYRPNDLGALKVNISFHRDMSGGEDRTITDITAEI